MKVTLNQLVPPATDIATSNKAARVSAADALPNQLPNRNTEQLAKEQLLAQVVSARKDGTAQLRTLAGNNLISLQTGQPLTSGQLVLLETTKVNGRIELSVQTGASLTNQILKLLVPSNGNLKTIVQNVIKTQSLNNGQVNSNNPQFSPNQTQAPHLTTGSNTTSKGNGLFSFLQSPANVSKVEANPPLTSPSANGGLLNKLSILLNYTSRSPANHPSSPPLPTVHQAQSVTTLLQSLTPTANLRDASNIPPLLQTGQMPPLLKLLLPSLQRTLMQAPVNGEQQQVRDNQLTAMTQLAARLFLGAIRAPSNGNEVELSRSEWIGRFDQSLDSLQVGLSVIREPIKEKERDQENRDEDTVRHIKQWRVRLAFEFEELGLITAFVLLSGNQKMEVQFWTERESTRQVLQRFRQQFDQRLDQAVAPFGIEHLNIDVFEGTPPPSRQNITQHLIDETA